MLTAAHEAADRNRRAPAGLQRFRRAGSRRGPAGRATDPLRRAAPRRTMTSKPPRSHFKPRAPARDVVLQLPESVPALDHPVSGCGHRPAPEAAPTAPTALEESCRMHLAGLSWVFHSTFHICGHSPPAEGIPRANAAAQTRSGTTSADRIGGKHPAREGVVWKPAPGTRPLLIGDPPMCRRSWRAHHPKPGQAVASGRQTAFLKVMQVVLGSRTAEPSLAERANAQQTSKASYPQGAATSNLLFPQCPQICVGCPSPRSAPL